MGRIFYTKPACALIATCALAAGLQAQTLTTLFTFDGTDGALPNAPLVQGPDGNFYGATQQGALKDAGTVFKVTPEGTLTTLHHFCSQSECQDGESPHGGLVLGGDGNFYGTTLYGLKIGKANTGTIFRITPEGTLTTLDTFCSAGLPCPSGYQPVAGLVQGASGGLYGATSQGGGENNGAFFSVTPAGLLTPLTGVCSSCENVYYPLVQVANGNFFGIFGDSIFKLSPSGTLTTLYTSANNLSSGLALGPGGDLYGGTGNGGTFFNGTIYRITQTGTLHVIANICVEAGCPAYPGTLVWATDGNFYGVSSDGPIFQVTPSGTITVLANLEVAAGGALLQATDGNFYGVTSGITGGTYDGTVFRLSMGLAPFVKTVPTVAQPGASIMILGNSLTGATSVSFDGTAAAFTVVSPTEITATVPAGASRGTVQVTTPSGTLSSNIPFDVLD